MRYSIMVMVTHKPQLLTRFTRVIVMANGQVVKDGPTQEVLRALAPRKLAEKAGTGGKARPQTEGTVNSSITKKKVS